MRLLPLDLLEVARMAGFHEQKAGIKVRRELILEPWRGGLPGALTGETARIDCLGIFEDREFAQGCFSEACRTRLPRLELPIGCTHVVAANEPLKTSRCGFRALG